VSRAGETVSDVLRKGGLLRESGPEDRAAAVSSDGRYSPTKLHGATSWKMAMLMTAAVRNSKVYALEYRSRAVVPMRRT
jgi:hypothetical protein